MRRFIINRSQSAGFLFISSRQNALNQAVSGSRGINVLLDYNWAIEPLEKRGLKLKACPKNDEDKKYEEILEKPSQRIQDLVDNIIALDLIEIMQLQRRLQRKLGIRKSTADTAFNDSVDPRKIRAFIYGGGVGAKSGAPVGGADAAAPAAAAPVAVKDSFDLKLKIVDASAKIKVIKEVRAITGLGLKEAKELVEKTPVVVKPGLKKDEAEALKKLLTDAGAEVELV